MNRNDFNPELREDLEVSPCIGLLELCSIARGVEVADAILKEASVQLLFASPVQPGKYVMLLTGSVRDVESSLRAGAEMAGADLVDQMHIPQVHEQVEVALRRRGGHIDGRLGSIGVIETKTVASAIVAADAALKTATVDLFDLRIANGLGGKSFLAIVGDVSDVRSAVRAGSSTAESSGKLERQVVIPQPHEDLARYL